MFYIFLVLEIRGRDNKLKQGSLNPCGVGWMEVRVVVKPLWGTAFVNSEARVVVVEC